MKKCPFCAEEIQEDAIKCKHCSADLLAQASGDGRISSLPCKQCGGKMMKKRMSGDITPSCILMVVGFLAAFFSGTLGVIIIIISFILMIVLGLASKKYWVCKKCNCKIEKW
jgi:hypothetical protein